LFTLYEVDVNALIAGNSKSKVVGFAFLPLLVQGAFTGVKQELQVHASLKSGYLGAVDLEGLEGLCIFFYFFFKKLIF
jgi:hypothetical protein